MVKVANVLSRLRTIPHDGIFRYLGIFNSERLVTTSPKALAEICTRNYEFIKPRQLMYFAGQILGPGLVLSEGDEHKRQRKLLMPAFAVKHIKDLYPVFWEKAKEVTDKMTELMKNDTSKEKELSTFDIGAWASRAALDVITLAALGKDFGAIKDPETPLNRTYRTIFEPTRLLQIFATIRVVIPEWIVNIIPIKHNLAMERAAQTIKATCRDVIHAKQEKLAKKELTDIDILSIMVRSQQIAEDGMVDQMMTFLAAGHETVSVGITWAIYMMCVHPDWQARLRAEVRKNLPSPLLNSETSITSTNIDQMPLLNAFCNEVIRYWPPIPMSVRTAACDTTILGHFVPKETRITIAITGTNRDKSLWGPDADQFKPQRWMTAEGKPDATGGVSSKYGFLSFMHGPRNCIGSGFARAEMACVVAAWVGRFEFALKDERELDEKNVVVSGGSFSAKPLKGIWVKAKVAEGW